jgi:hypothetical protein
VYEKVLYHNFFGSQSTVPVQYGQGCTLATIRRRRGTGGQYDGRGTVVRPSNLTTMYCTVCMFFGIVHFEFGISAATGREPLVDS